VEKWEDFADSGADDSKNKGSKNDFDTTAPFASIASRAKNCAESAANGGSDCHFGGAVRQSHFANESTVESKDARAEPY
jgi:hypothetical protein